MSKNDFFTDRKEHNVIFNAQEVRATLEYKKTQFRRLYFRTYRGERVNETPDGMREKVDFSKCPFGQVGDRIWVRETWYDSYKKTNTNNGCTYLADYGHRQDLVGYESAKSSMAWKSPIHMRREQSRITLEVENVRVDELHDITCGGRMLPSDVQKEGCPFENDCELLGTDEIEWFSKQWDSGSKKEDYKWSKNPWVWVITFKNVSND